MTKHCPLWNPRLYCYRHCIWIS